MPHREQRPISWTAVTILIVLVGFLAARAAGIDVFHWLGRATVRIIARTPFGNFLDDSTLSP